MSNDSISNYKMYCIIQLDPIPKIYYIDQKPQINQILN